jgi:uncharacterized membrane protein YqgA involved in biofilm formation
MIGTFLNAGAILVFGAWALLSKRQPSAKVQNALKGILGVATIIVGLRWTVVNLGSGGWSHFFKNVLIILLSLMLGRLVGQLLRLQKLSNRLGQFAKEKLEEAKPNQPQRFSTGFNVASLLFCLAPLAFLGAIADGTSEYWQVLAIKAVMDGLTILAFVATFSWGVVLSALPVLAFQGTLAMGARYFSAYLDPGMIASANATAGMVIFCVGLVILDLKKISLTDYLPSVLVAPAIVWLWPPW